MTVQQISASTPVQSQKWDVRFDDGRYHRARIGFVLLPNEQTLEADMIAHAPPGVGCFFTRGRMPPEISTDALRRMGDAMAENAGAIIPHEGLDVIAYACTSGTVAVGEAKTLNLLTEGAQGAKPTSLMTAVTEALSAIGATTLAVGTPYIDELNTNVARHLTDKGFRIAAFEGLNLPYDRDMVRVTPDYLVEFAKAIDHADADAVLISCGALRTIDVIDEIEQALGKPAICSNQALLWHCLRLAGIDDRLENLGRLLREH